MNVLSAASPLFTIHKEGPHGAGAPVSTLFTEQILWLSKQPYPPPPPTPTHQPNVAVFLDALTDGYWKVICSDSPSMWIDRRRVRS